MYRLLLILLVLPIAGCGGDDGKKPGAVNVSGKVTLNGKPLEGAEVNFLNGDHASVGVTGPDGTYTLAQGALPGKNKVFISKIDKSQFSSMTDVEGGKDRGQLEAAAQADDPDGMNYLQKAQELPAQFSDPEESILEVNVPEGGTESANFTLTK